MDMGLAVQEGVILKPIPGYDSKYVAGSDGPIYCYSNARVNSKKPKPFRVSESISSTGYPHIGIFEGGRKRTKTVHVMVCAAFHGSKPSKIHEVRHFDGVRTNSKPSNLLWGTPPENEADKRRHGTVAEGSRHGNAKLNEEAVRILRLAIPQGLWNPVDAAMVFAVDPSVIRSIVSGRSWKHV
jgi:hypothetical protein